MDAKQEQQIREWAAALGDRDDPERRAMGRAMLMLLDEIAMLRARVARTIEADRADVDPAAVEHARTEPEGEAPEPARFDPEPTVPLDEGQDTAPMRLRDRIRHAAERLGHED
ncbi:MAG TPA: hypothetical protein VMU66_01795 [Gaiellales bacterium]|nr:hypothetical protein [Gaiellales bacterium]